MAYRIKDWSLNFENNRTRDLKRMEWVPVPNKMDGSGYTELVDHPNGAAHLGAWLAILEIASRQTVRGDLPQASTGTAKALSRISRLPVTVFEEVLPRLASIGWLEQQDQENETLAKISQVDAGIPQVDAAKCPLKGREGNGTEVEENHSANAIAFPRELPPPAPSVRSVLDSAAILGDVVQSSDYPQCSKIPKSIAIVDEITNWYNREFYPLYPRHKARDKGLAAAKAKLKTRELRDQAMKALMAQLPELRSRDPVHVPYPASWINSGSFADEPDSLFRPAVREVYQDRDQRKLAEAITMQEIMRGMYDPAKRM